MLRNALLEDRLAHAYLFSGPRGVGKTSAARILAKSLNCVNGPTTTPCGKCVSCQAVRDGSFMDVIEIDGASNNSVDDIRDLREKVKYAPSGSRYKIYIIDEAHMLSTAAFNALLKTLEEPPPNVIFVLATTAPNKIISTVLSRCQHLPFKRVPSSLIKERLMLVSQAEGFNISDEALELIARAADGGMRDCLTLLDKIASFTNDITVSAVRDLLGIADLSSVSAIANAIITGDRVQILRIIDALYDSGVDLRGFVSELTVFFRDALSRRVYNQQACPSTPVAGLLTPVDVETLTVILNELIKAHPTIKTFFSPRIVLEMTLIKLSLLSSLRGVEGIVSELMQKAAESWHLPTLPPSIYAGQQKEIRPQPATKPALPALSPRNDAQPNDVLLSLISPVVDTQPSTALSANKNPEVPPIPTARPISAGLNTTPAQSGSGKDFWQNLVEEVTNISEPLGGRLSEATFEFTADALNVYFSGGSFNVNASSVEKGKKTIATVAEQLTGKKYKVHVKNGSPDGTSTPESNGAKAKNTPAARDLKAEAMADPVVKERLEEFGAQIVSIKPPTDK
ncbi:DNA polymerase III subunit gamma/tau [Candidatus Magnetobacterium bavaricum]|uniref:DNA polymerase III subunit gamma/tau n=1 Tax=Candidatus Magnetobacterium bavaricum TaxID=29290 RepID=A0A0F3GL51_9BACT|nr:DNA polymerase III subunit gamma/tau [Candidatus Magnetobacterium bavaricum]